MRHRHLLAFVTFALLVLGAVSLPHRGAAVQLDREVRDRVVPSAVQIGLAVDVEALGISESINIPIGSGTIVSKSGLILTNAHVVDVQAIRRELTAWRDQATREGAILTFDISAEHVVILGSDGSGPVEPLFTAEIVLEDQTLDLAVLQIVSDASGEPIDSNELDLMYVPLGTSKSVELGDPIDIFSYPAAGGSALTYTSGVVSGFVFEDGIEGFAWINTDATISGGSSGGTAVNRDGELVGVPTQGSELDCRPGDTNRDGEVNAYDVGCIPVGGSIGQLRPIDIARPILEAAGFRDDDLALSGESASAAATIEAYATRETDIEQQLERQVATMAALATENVAREDELNEMTQRAAQVAAAATEDAINAKATIVALDNHGKAQSTMVARLEAENSFEQGTLSPLSTAQAELAIRATEMAELQAQHADAQVTATALAEIATNATLDPNQQSISIQTDLDGMLGSNQNTLDATRGELQRILSRYPVGCRAGFVLISGNAPSIEQGIELAERVEALLRQERSDIFTEETGFEQFAQPNVEPYGQASIQIFFYSGCEPIG